jgi:hypothetical protein
VAFQPKTCKWGDPTTQQVVWRDNDAADLAGNLRGVRVFIRSGNGKPGPFDRPAPPANSIAGIVLRIELLVEYGAHLENLALVKRLHAHQVRTVNARFYDGSHSPPYWIRDMRQFVPWLEAQFRHPPTPPPAFAVKSAHQWFTAWGWAFRVRRRVREFVYLRITGNQLRATGSGTIVIHTPSRFRPGAGYEIRIGHRVMSVQADDRARIRFVLDLGPSHTKQQTEFGRGATHGWRTSTATITSPQGARTS